MDSNYIVAPNNKVYYSSLPAGRDSLCKHAVEAADDNIDFSLFDSSTDSDLMVDFVIFIHPANPVAKDTSGSDEDSIPAYPFLNGNNYGIANDVGDTIMTDDGVTIKTCVHLGSTNSYYLTGSSQFTKWKAMHLMAHETGHDLGLPDYYESDGDTTTFNPYAYSAGQGKYSVMQLGYYTKHAHLYSPQERIKLGWIEPTEITVNSQHFGLIDFNTHPNSVPGVNWDSVSRVYKLPVHQNEYFLITNHQQTTHWEDDYGWSFPDKIEADPYYPDTLAKGVMIWHIQTTFGATSELARKLDLECAEGFLNLTGNPDSLSPWGIENGWDRLDRWCGGDAWLSWDSLHNASSSHRNDFFRPGYRTAFHSLTNPSSDAYNVTNDTTYGLINCEYPGGSTWHEVTEYGYRQNIATHISIEGIQAHPTIDNAIKLCIRRSRIWTDSVDAMDRTTQRKFLYRDGELHFVYPSKGYVYYTSSDAPHQYWNTAVLFGNGSRPAMALDESNDIYSVWQLPSDSIRYRRYNKFTQDHEATLGLTGTPEPVAIDFSPMSDTGGFPGAVGGGGPTVDLIHLAYLIEEDSVMYTFFRPTQPETIGEEVVDDSLVDDTSRVKGASIEVDTTNFKVFVAYGCIKKDSLGLGNDVPGCYYRERDGVGANPWTKYYLFTESIDTTSDGPLVPFVDIEGQYVRVAFNAYDSIYYGAKLCDDDYDENWVILKVPLPDSWASGENRYPQIDGNVVVWTHVYPLDHDTLPGDTIVCGYDFIADTLFRLDKDYCPNGYFCQVTTAGSSTSTAYLYQHGTFTGPKWAIYYRGPSGELGNMMRYNPIVEVEPDSLTFSMFIPGNIFNSPRFSVYTTAECDLNVYDVTGRRVTQIKIEPGAPKGMIQTFVDCHNWSSGIYFVRAIHEEDERTITQTKKVLLMH